MATRKMNVLVYSGNGSTIGSVRHCLDTFRRLLTPNYAIIPVTESVISREPWIPSCALLVFPGGSDAKYCYTLAGEGNRAIEQYVRSGGAFAGFCAGGYFGSSTCEFEVGNALTEVVGDRELSFFPGICRGGAFKGFTHHSEVGAKAVRIQVNKEGFASGAVPASFLTYYNGGGIFVGAEQYSSKGVEVLASYEDPLDVEGGTAAVVYCKVGEGGVLLTGPHPEFAAFNLSPTGKYLSHPDLVKDLEVDDEARDNFLKACLAKLGLIINHDTSPMPSISRLHLSSVHYSLVSRLLASWKGIITVEDGEEYIKGENDTFHLESRSPSWPSNPPAESRYVRSGKKKDKDEELNSSDSSKDGLIDYDAIVKGLLPHVSDLPATGETPYFNHRSFFASLLKYQAETNGKAEEFGRYIMYGEVLTSTNTVLEKNPKLLSKLPQGFTCTATTQIAGRGRGSNVWLAPPGSLIFSTTIKHPITLNNFAPIAFIQYLAAIAIVQGIQSYDRGYETLPIKLKWPNDIYAQDPSKPGQESYIKIGGMLINCSYSSGFYDLVVGIGINTYNSAPTISLNQLLPPDLSPFTIERLLARILTCFEVIYKRFCRTGFDKDIEYLYYKYWLHSGQIVILEQEGGARARIKGISSKWGLLQAEELDRDDRATGKVWELQSDSNSFDFFKGLLKTKT